MENRALELFHMIIAEMRPEDGHKDIPALNESIDELDDILSRETRGCGVPRPFTREDYAANAPDVPEDWCPDFSDPLSGDLQKPLFRVIAWRKDYAEEMVKLWEGGK